MHRPRKSERSSEFRPQSYAAILRANRQAADNWEPVVETLQGAEASAVHDIRINLDVDFPRVDQHPHAMVRPQLPLKQTPFFMADLMPWLKTLGLQKYAERFVITTFDELMDGTEAYFLELGLTVRDARSLIFFVNQLKYRSKQLISVEYRLRNRQTTVQMSIAQLSSLLNESFGPRNIQRYSSKWDLPSQFMRTLRFVCFGIHRRIGHQDRESNIRRMLELLGRVLENEAFDSCIEGVKAIESQLVGCVQAQSPPNPVTDNLKPPDENKNIKKLNKKKYANPNGGGKIAEGEAKEVAERVLESEQQKIAPVTPQVPFENATTNATAPTNTDAKKPLCRQALINSTPLISYSPQQWRAAKTKPYLRFIRNTVPGQCWAQQAGPGQFKAQQVGTGQFYSKRAVPAQFQGQQAVECHFQEQQVGPDQFPTQQAHQGQQQTQQADPGWFQTKQAGPGKFKAHLDAPGQFSVQQGGPGWFQTKHTGPGQFQKQQNGPGHFQVPRVCPGQFQGQQAGPGHFQPQEAGPGKFQVQQDGPGHFQTQQTGPGQFQTQQARPAQFQAELAGPGWFQIGADQALEWFPRQDISPVLIQEQMDCPKHSPDQLFFQMQQGSSYPFPYQPNGVLFYQGPQAHLPLCQGQQSVEIGFPAQQTGSNSFAALQTDADSYPAQQTDPGSYPAQQSGLSSFPTQKTGSSSYPVQQTGSASFLVHGTSSGPFPGQQTDPASFPAQQIDSALLYPALQTGSGSYAAQQTGSSSFPAQQTASSSFSAQQTRPSLYPAQQTRPGSFPAQWNGSRSLTAEQSSPAQLAGQQLSSEGQYMFPAYFWHENEAQQTIQTDTEEQATENLELWPEAFTWRPMDEPPEVQTPQSSAVHVDGAESVPEAPAARSRDPKYVLVPDGVESTGLPENVQVILFQSLAFGILQIIFKAAPELFRDQQFANEAERDLQKFMEKRGQDAKPKK